MRVTTANLDFSTGPRQDKKNLALLVENSDVLCLQEAKNLTLSEILPVGWRSLQFTLNEARRNSAHAVVKGAYTKNRAIHLGVRPWYGGVKVKMLTRFFTTVDVTKNGLTVRAFSCHLPPARFDFLQPTMMRRIKTAIDESPWPVVLGGDWNMPIATAASKLGLEAHGEGIIGVLVDKRLKITATKIDRRGKQLGYTDHPAVTVVIDPTSAVPPRTIGS